MFEEALDNDDGPEYRPEELQGRARRLRHHARRLPPLVSIAYRRRASELELMAWAIENGPDEAHRSRLAACR